ncbi:MAG: ABC transporter permease subunit [Acutalibacteraceae bacterium]|nr:ABC transporter permease subunit [Acutalibacteraceae bacterium]
MTQIKRKGLDLVTKLIFISVFAVFILFPLISMLIYIDADSSKAVFNSAQFLPSVTHSLITALVATVITIAISFALAVCISRVNIKLKGFFSIIFTLPMLIPSISHGMGLLIVLGNNGIITRALNLSTSIYGFTGIVAGSVMYAFPVAFIMISDILKYQDYSPYEAAKILGLGSFRRFSAITLPYLRKPLISIIFAVFTMIITDYGVPLIIGGKYKTLSVLMYEEVIGRLEFKSGAVIGALLLIPAIVAFLLDLMNKDKGNMTFVIKPFEPSNKPLSKIFAYVFCSVISLVVVVPIFCFGALGFAKRYPIDLTLTIRNIEKALSMEAGTYLVNSLIISVAVALLGTAVCFLSAYLTARAKTKLSKVLHLILITAAAIPGMVLGLSYAMSFSGTAIYNTMAILIAVNVVHFVASPYMMIYNSLSKINENLEDVGKTMGIGKVRMIKDVFLAQSMPTVCEMASYFFVNSMMTISAVSFLANTSTKPIALMINQFEANMQLECAAIVSLAILIVNIIVKAVFRLITRRKAK